MSSAFRIFSKPGRSIHMAHEDGGFKLTDIISVATSNNAEIMGEMFLFPDYTSLQNTINTLEVSYEFLFSGNRSHKNGGKKLYFGIQGKESDIITLTKIIVSAGSNLGMELYVYTESNMNGNIDYNNTINNDMNDIEAGASA
jgi:hypothetical protein